MIELAGGQWPVVDESGWRRWALPGRDAWGGAWWWRAVRWRAFGPLPAGRRRSGKRCVGGPSGPPGGVTLAAVPRGAGWWVVGEVVLLFGLLALLPWVRLS